MNLKNKALIEEFNKKNSYIDEDQEKEQRMNRRSFSNYDKAERIASGAMDVKTGSAEKDNRIILSGLRKMGII